MTVIPIPGDGTTLAELRSLVLTNTFSTSRYSTLTDRWLNDAVMDVCRRLQLIKTYEVVTVTDSVASTTVPFYKLDEVWTANAPAGSGEVIFRAGALRQLRPIPYDSPAGANSQGEPWCYSVRKSSPGSEVPALRIVVHPGTVAYVALAGRARPDVMADDDDVSGLDGELDDALVAFAKARCFRNEDDFEMSASWMAEYKERVSSVNTPPHTGPIITPGMWDETSPRAGAY